MSAPPLEDEVSQALVGDVDPAGLDAFRFARAILPVFPLVRALFSQNELDTCLKLMLLHELSRAGGRSSLERIRALAGFLDPERVDGLVRSLRDGGWLELRASDNTYGVALVGLNLLTLLHAADLGSVSPQNGLARAARMAELNARLDGATPAVALLLDQLRALLDDEVAEARAVLSRGRPLRLIAWSRREHARQLDTVRDVLGWLQERLDASSREFGRIVRLHEAMQELVRMHTGIHARLREWNLDRLHTSDAGYAVQELAEAVLGIDDAALDRVVADGLLLALAPAPSLLLDEVRARFQAARRRLQSARETFVYAPPAAPSSTPWSAAESDDAALLRARLTRSLADRSAADPPLELEGWIAGDTFREAAWDLAVLGVLEGLEPGAQVTLDDGRRARVEVASPSPAGVPPGELLAWLVAEGGLRELAAGRLARVQLAVASDG
ncbi:MAG: hypothetical protein U1F43_32400 [Myxococcota bacterium]